MCSTSNTITRLSSYSTLAENHLRRAIRISILRPNHMSQIGMAPSLLTSRIDIFKGVSRDQSPQTAGMQIRFFMEESEGSKPLRLDRWQYRSLCEARKRFVNGIREWPEPGSHVLESSDEPSDLLACVILDLLYNQGHALVLIFGKQSNICLVWCPGQNKRIAPLSFLHGCRKRRLKD
jgi:hypothetical protein